MVKKAIFLKLRKKLDSFCKINIVRIDHCILQIMPIIIVQCCCPVRLLQLIL